MRISPENATTLYALVKKIGLKNTEVVLTGVTPGGEYKVARPEGPRYGQAAPGTSPTITMPSPSGAVAFRALVWRFLLQWISGILQTATTARILKASQAYSRCPLMTQSGSGPYGITSCADCRVITFLPPPKYRQQTWECDERLFHGGIIPRLHRATFKKSRMATMRFSETMIIEPFWSIV